MGMVLQKTMPFVLLYAFLLHWSLLYVALGDPEEPKAAAIRLAVLHSLEHTPEETLYKHTRTHPEHGEVPVLHEPGHTYHHENTDNHYSLEFGVPHHQKPGESKWKVTAHNFTHYRQLRELFTEDPGEGGMDGIAEGHRKEGKHKKKDWRVAHNFRSSFEKHLVLLKDAGGSSDSESLYRTADMRYVVKTKIKKEEVKKLAQILDEYVAYYQERRRRERRSLLVPFCELEEEGGSKEAFNFVIMPFIKALSNEFLLVDFKGCTSKRYSYKNGEKTEYDCEKRGGGGRPTHPYFTLS